MLSELRVENVGVIADLGLVFGGGMTAITGETGAGKTLVVESIELLLGARADGGLVRKGSAEARVEARFELAPAEVTALRAIESSEPPPEGELVLARVVPAEGRSRAYLNGRLVPAVLLAEVGAVLVDLHGQHSHHALLRPAAQRAALDAFGGSALSEARAAYQALRTARAEAAGELADRGGDARERLREIELLAFQVAEIDEAEIEDPEEEASLEAEEALLGSAGAYRESAHRARSALEGTVADDLGAAAAELGATGPLASHGERVKMLQEEVVEAARAIRLIEETIDEDPERLAAVGERRHRLRDLRRKYGDTLAEVLVYRDTAAARCASIEGAERRAAELEERLVELTSALSVRADALSEARREAAEPLARRVQEELRRLGMPAAEFAIAVRPMQGREFPDAGVDDVEFLLAANPGEGAQALAAVVSGGELARAMLAARVVMTEAPPTVVFDEVDAGIGGEAGVAVGARLAAVAARHQVLCVTHLAQVAAFADRHVVVGKEEHEGRTVAHARVVESDERVRELSRMLSGSDTERAREHAQELLADAGGVRR